MNLHDEWIEGKLCEFGFFEEKFDLGKNDLVRKLTLKGRKLCRELIQDNPKEFLSIAEEFEKAIPIDLRNNFWKEVYDELK